MGEEGKFTSPLSFPNWIQFKLLPLMHLRPGVTNESLSICLVSFESCAVVFFTALNYNQREHFL